MVGYVLRDLENWGYLMSELVQDGQKWLAVAEEAAKVAQQVTMGFFNQHLAVETKADDSPVTEADRAAERAIRQVIERAFPDHDIVGEEYGGSSEGRVVWLIDPIDGTRSFIRGLPFWSIQIALMVDGELVVGVSSAPAFSESASALSGHGATLNGEPLAVRSIDRLESADVSFGNIRSLANSSQWPWVGALIQRAARSRGYGDFYSYHRLAQGQQDVGIESDVNILDVAALAVIVEEAGGVITDLQGQPIGLGTTSVLAACPTLHESLLKDLLSF